MKSRKIIKFISSFPYILGDETNSKTYRIPGTSYIKKRSRRIINTANTAQLPMTPTTNEIYKKTLNLNECIYELVIRQNVQYMSDIVVSWRWRQQTGR